MEEKYKEVIELVKVLEGMSEEYKDAMEINWELGMGILVKLVRFLEKYKKGMEINWNVGMGIVMELVKRLAGMLEEYEDVMEIN